MKSHEVDYEIFGDDMQIIEKEKPYEWIPAVLQPSPKESTTTSSALEI